MVWVGVGVVPWCTALVWSGMDLSWLCLSLFSSFSCVVFPWSAAPEWSGVFGMSGWFPFVGASFGDEDAWGRGWVGSGVLCELL